MKRDTLADIKERMDELMKEIRALHDSQSLDEFLKTRGALAMLEVGAERLRKLIAAL